MEDSSKMNSKCHRILCFFSLFFVIKFQIKPESLDHDCFDFRIETRKTDLHMGFELNFTLEKDTLKSFQ